MPILVTFLRTMSMPEKLVETCSLPDESLFTSKGCHIFSRTLLELLPNEEFELRHICGKVLGTGDQQSGVHVYLVRLDYAIDAKGIRPEQELIEQYTCRDDVFTYVAEPCSLEILFTKDDEMEKVGDVNEWGLALNPEFVASVEDRARKFINSDPSRFQVSLLLVDKKTGA